MHWEADYKEMLKKLRQARQEAGLTIEEAADGFDRPPSFILAVESGERRIDPVELCRFAVLYRKPVTWFLAESGPGRQEGDGGGEIDPLK
ncbi:MAG TPA: helix-turn-helix transcriptional regulator [Thermoanaerobaculia bacterium]|jgi:transcriptional regulator with XRE-family HTH domain|nr:helix-turn-helix transcriptional regulator [Thermoanaerobaculia bacterium]